MELAFATRELRGMCENASVAGRALDAAVAEQLRARLADLRAADNVADLPLALTIVGINGAAAVTIDLAQGYRMVMKPNHPKTPVDDKGQVAWQRVRRLQIVAIERAW